MTVFCGSEFMAFCKEMHLSIMMEGKQMILSQANYCLDSSYYLRLITISKI